ncbi:conserved hypothetical protein [Pseudomonas sp. 8AS]|uniref:hypothetical protein n=1 Tax=Pseudomonas sp. 8AS TaxID=2653163 RepID=UPI0012F118BB|nr:hypothetical protein [Pseudomonas sp. 8AS]VXB03922.1 conserved hypothetical protein [Pseudomonas sp. 8AS]
MPEHKGLHRKTHLLIGTLLSALLCLDGCSGNSQSSDVSDYVSSRDNCDALRGDIPEPTEPDRLNRVISDINKYCKGTDQRLKQLREKYSGNESVMKTLSNYEENIEAGMSF